MEFTVTAPQSISGISGTVCGSDSRLSYKDTVIAFSPLAEGVLSPVAAPYALVRCWESGYIRTCGTDEDGLCFSVDTFFCEKPILSETWLDPKTGFSVYGELSFNNQRILSLKLTDFIFTD